MSTSDGGRAPTTRELEEAARTLDNHLRHLIRRTQRLLIIVIAGQTILIGVLGYISFNAIHSKAVSIQNQVYRGQHDACDIFLEIALGGYGQPVDAAGVRGIEDAREIYITRGCRPPALPPPSPALRAEAVKYGVELKY